MILKKIQPYERKFAGLNRIQIKSNKMLYSER